MMLVGLDLVELEVAPGDPVPEEVFPGELEVAAEALEAVLDRAPGEPLGAGALAKRARRDAPARERSLPTGASTMKPELPETSSPTVRGFKTLWCS